MQRLLRTRITMGMGWFGLLLLASSEAFALGVGPARVAFEPVVGYEWVQKSDPVPHRSNRLVYGARVTAGWRVLGAELELTQSSATERFSDLDITVSDTDTRGKFGLRGSVYFFSLIEGQLRAGLQGSRTHRERTEGGVFSETTSDLFFDPYAGLGAVIDLGRRLTLNAGVTVIFLDFPQLDRNDYQTTLALGIHL